MKNIFVLIDLQNDFILPNGKLTVNAPNLIQKTQKFVDRTTARFDEYWVTYDTHFEESYNQTEEAKSYPPHCMYLTKGWQVPVTFPPNKPVRKFIKATTNLWAEEHQYPTLKEDLKNTTFYVAGVCSDICVIQAIDGLLQKGANVVVLRDLTKGLAKEMDAVVQTPYYQKLITRGQLKIADSKSIFTNVYTKGCIERD